MFAGLSQDLHLVPRTNLDVLEVSTACGVGSTDLELLRRFALGDAVISVQIPPEATEKGQLTAASGGGGVDALQFRLAWELPSMMTLVPPRDEL
jgi:hypothetical protein